MNMERGVREAELPERRKIFNKFIEICYVKLKILIIIQKI